MQQRRVEDYRKSYEPHCCELLNIFQQALSMQTNLILRYCHTIDYNEFSPIEPKSAYMEIFVNTFSNAYKVNQTKTYVLREMFNQSINTFYLILTRTIIYQNIKKQRNWQKSSTKTLMLFKILLFSQK